MINGVPALLIWVRVNQFMPWALAAIEYDDEQG